MLTAVMLGSRVDGGILTSDSLNKSKTTSEWLKIVYHRANLRFNNFKTGSVDDATEFSTVHLSSIPPNSTSK